MTKMIFVNLPTTDLARSRAFYENNIDRSYGDSACAPRRRVLPMEVDSIRIIVDWSGS